MSVRQSVIMRAPVAKRSKEKKRVFQACLGVFFYITFRHVYVGTYVVIIVHIIFYRRVRVTLILNKT